jgi:hypothetical protein
MNDGEQVLTIYYLDLILDSVSIYWSTGYDSLGVMDAFGQ